MNVTEKVREAIRREPALALILALSFILNVYYFYFPSWNPDSLVKYAWGTRLLTTWNHHGFFYGSWHVNVIKIFIVWPMLGLQWLWPPFDAALGTLWAARVLAAAMGTGCVFFAWGLARTMAGRAAAIVAAFGLATMPFHINLSHFSTADVPSLFYSLGGVYFLARYAADRERRRWFYVSAVFIGLALSTKYVGVLFGAAVLVYLIGELAGRRITPREFGRELLIYGGIVAATFVITSLQMFFFPETVRENIMLNVNINRGRSEVVAIGFKAFPRMLLRAMGWVWLLGGLAGLAAALAHRKSRLPALMLFAGGGATFLFFGSAYYYPFRYVMPIAAPLIIFAGAGAGLLWNAAQSASVRRALAVVAILAGLVYLARGVSAAVAFPADTRLQAERFIEETLQPGDQIAYSVPWMIYFPYVPEDITRINLHQDLPDDFRLEPVLEERNIQYVMTSSLNHSNNHKPAEEAFYKRLAAGETAYRLLCEFRPESTIVFNPRSVEFLNPVIRIYEREPGS